MVEEHHEETHEEEGGRSLRRPGAGGALPAPRSAPGLGIWAAPKIAPAPALGHGAGREVADPRPGRGRGPDRGAAGADRHRARRRSRAASPRCRPATMSTRGSARAVAAAEARLTAEIAAAREAAAHRRPDGGQPAARAARRRARRARRPSSPRSRSRSPAPPASSRKRPSAGSTPTAARSRPCAARWARVRDAVSGLRDPARRRRGPRRPRGRGGAGQGRRDPAAGRRPSSSAAGVAADIAAIRAAVAGGQPFQQPLAALAGQTGAAPPAGLAAAAESGVATLSALRESYPDAAHAAIRASIMASAGDGVLARSAGLPRGPGLEPLADAAGRAGHRRGAVADGGQAAPGRPRRRARRGGGAALRGGGGDGRLARGRARPGRRRSTASRRSTRRSTRPTEGGGMLWSLVKIVAFLAIAAALVFGLGWILETPGEVRIAFGPREFYVSPIGFLDRGRLLVFLGILLLKLVGLLVAVVRFLLGDETAISRHFSRSRERRGYDALSDGILALAAGDTRTAMKKAQKADRLLAAARPDRPPDRPGGGAQRRPRPGLRGLQGAAARRPDPAGRGAGADAAQARGGRHRRGDGARQEGLRAPAGQRGRAAHPLRPAVEVRATGRAPARR